MLNMGELVLSCLCCCFGPIGSHLDLVHASSSSKLCVLPSNWYSRMSPSSRCASFQMVSIHPSQQVANSDKDKIVDALTCLLRKGAISLSHGALDIVDSVVTSYQMWQPKKGTAVDQEENHHCESAMRQATEGPPYYPHASMSHLQ